MLDLNEHKKIVVLIDADNAQYSKIKFILNEISTHGHIITKRAYGDWSSEHLKNWKTTLNELAIQPIQQFAYTTGKNATDSMLIIDAMDLLYTQAFDGFCLVSSDSDFTGLAIRIREAGLEVIGFGEKKTPQAFRSACNKFITTEVYREERDSAAQPEQAGIRTEEESYSMLTEIIESFAEQEWVHLGQLGDIMNKRNPDFDARNYGYRNLSAMLQSKQDTFELVRGNNIGMSHNLPYVRLKS